MKGAIQKALDRLYRLPSSEVANSLTAFGVCINILLLAATTVLAIFSYLQWRETNETLQEIKRQTPAVLQTGKAAELSAQTAVNEARSSDASTEVALAEMRKQSRAAQTLAGATQQTASTAMRQLDLSERPSLVITGTKLPAVGVNSFGNVSYSVDVLVDNTGRSPATNVALIPQLAVSPGFTGSIPATLAGVCHSQDKFGPLSGEMVPQGEKAYRISRQPNLARGGPLSNALRAASVDPQTGNRTVQAGLVVCVLYRSPISPAVHHTALMYDVGIVFSPNEVAEIESGAMPQSHPIVVWSERITLHKQEVMNGLAD